LFLERATERFADHSFLSTALLDIETDPLSQGFRAGAFDVVIAANVLHAAADLAEALAHIRTLLAPAGLLFLLEGVAPERWVDLTFGLTEGWWRFTDHARRPDYPLVGRERWLELLAGAGFIEPAAIPADGGGRAISQQALLVARAPSQSRSWVLVGGDSGIAAAVSSRLAARGEPVISLPAAASTGEMMAAEVIVYLGALDLADLGPDDPAACDLSASLACSVPLSLLGELGRRGFAGQVWLVTRGAAEVEEGCAAGAQWQAPLWGAGRVFGLEHPGAWGGLVDLPPSGTGDALAKALLTAIDGDDGEDQTAWRDGRRFVLRLARAAEAAAVETGETLCFQAEATYLVTGGFGGLGQVVARWMAERGARHLALLGRRPDPDAAGVREIESLGAKVYSLQGDVADEASLRAHFQQLAVIAPPVRGIVHAAADLSVAPIVELTPAAVSAMLSPKMHGTLLLERLGRELDLHFLVLFSSTTALLGAAGLAHYAAANEFLDVFARRADRPDRRVVAINWGIWDVMRLASAAQQQKYRDGGLHPMPVPEALAALGQVLRGKAANAMVARIDWETYKPLHESRRRRPILSRLGLMQSSAVLSGDAAAAPERPGAPGLVARLANAPAAARRDLLVGFVSREVATVLGLDPMQPIATGVGLFDLGMDSLMSVELKGRLERGAGRKLPATLTFNYPNIGALALFLMNLLGHGVEREASETAQAPDSPVPQSFEDIDLDTLSDDEIETRLLARMEQSQ
jgi:NAD(P)-dependent dehydrogenase (short-subunit alcohol dehydrogenase family)